jgi:tetratricopeptide (TPR) repeat protein
LADARRLAGLQDYTGAEAAYRKLLKRQPKNVELHLELVSVLLQLRSSEANRVAWDAVRLQPDNYRTHHRLASTFGNSSPQGELSVRESLRHKPDYAPAHNKLAYVLASRGQPAEAITAARRAVELMPEEAQFRHTLACLLSEQGDDAGAIAAYQQELALRPDRPNSQEHLGWIFWRAGRQADADEQFQKARALKEGEFRTLGSLGVHFAEYGYLWKAQGQFQAHFAEYPGDYAYAMRLAILQLYHRERSAFETTVKQALERFNRESDPEGARRLLTVCLISPQVVGEPEQHKRLAGIVAGEELPSKLSCRERGLYAYRTGDWEGALKWCRESRQRNQEATKEQLIDAQNFLIEAMALARLNNAPQARQSYEAATRNASDYARVAPHSGVGVGAKWFDWVMYEIYRREALELVPIEDDSDWPRSADRGLFAAAEGDWKKSAGEFARACQSPATSAHLAMQASVALAMAGDREAYSRHCRAMQDRFAESDIWFDQERVGKGCLLMEGGIPPSGLHIDILRKSLDDGSVPSGMLTWGQATGALLALREGQWERAVELGDRAAAETHEVYAPARAIGLMCSALGNQKLSHAQVAQEKLAAGLKLRDESLALSTGQIDQRLVLSEVAAWHDWMIVELLRREAENASIPQP